MWLLWTGGNDRLWDRLTVDSFGTFDLLKTISSHPGMSYGRHNRFRYLGTRQRAVLRRTGRPRSRSLGAVDRPPRSGLPARSVCRRGPLPGRAHRRTRPDDARGLVPTASRPASSGSGCSRTPRSTRKPDSAGTPIAITPTRTTTTIRSWFARIVSGCRARSVTWARTPSSLPRIPNARSGRTSARTSARSTSGGIASSTGRGMRTSRASSSRRCTSRGPARSTPRSCPPTTSPIRAR